MGKLLSDVMCSAKNYGKYGEGRERDRHIAREKRERE